MDRTFVKIEWGVETNSAILNAEWGVPADSAVCNKRVGSWNKLHSFGKQNGVLKQTLHFWKSQDGARTTSAFFKNILEGSRGLCILQKQNGELKQTPHCLKAQWGVRLNSAFCKNKIAVQGDSTEGGVHVNSEFCKTQWRFQADSTFCKNRGGSSSGFRILENHSGDFGGTLQRGECV